MFYFISVWGPGIEKKNSWFWYEVPCPCGWVWQKPCPCHCCDHCRVLWVSLVWGPHRSLKIPQLEVWSLKRPFTGRGTTRISELFRVTQLHCSGLKDKAFPENSWSLCPRHRLLEMEEDPAWMKFISVSRAILIYWFFVIHILNSFLRAWRASSQLQIFKVHNWASFDLHLHKPRKASAAEDTITLSHQFSVPVPLPTGVQTSRLPSKQHLHLLIWVKQSHGAELHSSCHVFTNSLALFLLDRHITTCPSAC